MNNFEKKKRKKNTIVLAVRSIPWKGVYLGEDTEVVGGEGSSYDFTQMHSDVSKHSLCSNKFFLGLSIDDIKEIVWYISHLNFAFAKWSADMKLFLCLIVILGLVFLPLLLLTV